MSFISFGDFFLRLFFLDGEFFSLFGSESNPGMCVTDVTQFRRRVSVRCHTLPCLYLVRDECFFTCQKRREVSFGNDCGVEQRIKSLFGLNLIMAEKERSGPRVPRLR